ncbi:hypothetical protein RI845_07350 [Thalassotalea nanhaiensis]|uniref:DNA-binding protein n=1 Tax=Thalassotalea nanhaiensis TaxID=3065648 RepID=A0ABY9TNP3_9GAMM|nr:hypothetical protein RI845_07350 [Colwelliaceae bacterium SQ345]
MRKLKPSQYLAEYYPGAGYCTKTVINWIKRGKIKGEQTPTDRWLVVVEDSKSTKITELVKLLEASV